MKLAAKLMFVFLAAVMLMTAVGSYFSVRRGFERFQQQQQQMARDAADVMNERLAQAYRVGGVEGLLAAMEAGPIMAGRQRVRWVWFEQSRRIPGGSRTTVVKGIQVSGGRAVSTTYTDPAGTRHLQTYYPVDLGDGPQGGLEVTGSLESLDAEARETIQMALVSLGAMALFSLGLVYVAGIRWVAHPLQKLIAKTEQIGSGEFGEPLHLGGNDELSQLAVALNAMSGKLSEQQEQIRSEATARLATLEQLRHADRLKTVGRLAAGIAHELGTPLNVVSGRAGLIASGQLTPEEVASSATTIKEETERITAIIRQLLDFARRNAPRRSQVNLVSLIEQTVQLLAPLAESRNVTLEIADSPASVVAEVDVSQLQQVITNLLVNGIHASPDGGRLQVALATDRDAEPQESSSNPSADAAPFVRISVQDFGQGISPEDLPHIFEPFFTTKEVGEGTGLGLSIAHGIVQEHGGWIDVESELGRGSRFTIYLPA